MIYRQNDLTDLKLTQQIEVLQQKRLIIELCLGWIETEFFSTKPEPTKLIDTKLTPDFFFIVQTCFFFLLLSKGTLKLVYFKLPFYSSKNPENKSLFKIY